MSRVLDGQAKIVLRGKVDSSLDVLSGLDGGRVKRDTSLAAGDPAG